MRPGRNHPCPCGSGRKFKHCCGQVTAAASAAPPASREELREIGTLVGLVNHGALGAAEARANALLKMYPDAGILWKILSVALVRQGRDALPALRRAAELLPQDAEAHANLGAELHARARWEPALASLIESLRLEPHNVDALVQAGDAQRALGRAREAVSLYQRALQLDGRRRDAHNNLGNACLDLGQAAEAARCYRRALELKADDAEVLCNLGNALRQLGELDEAMTASRRAIALAPTLSMAHNNLGLLLQGRGERQEAVAAFRAALRLKPDYVEAQQNLARVLRELGELPEALALFQQALQRDPSRAERHCDLGYALLDSRRIADSADSFRRALALQPASVPAHLGLAAALRMQGAYDDAEASCRAALAAAPDDPGAATLLGELHADRGHFAEAQEQFQRAVRADADFIPAYGSIAAHRRMSSEDRAWLAAVQRLLGKPLPLVEEMHLRYALGKYLDDVGDYDAAFDSYRAANQLAGRFGPRYDPEHFSALVDRIIGVCTQEWVRAERAGACGSELPVFIIGMPRSGTSLTEQILASHPSVHGAGELRYWDGAFARFAACGGADAGATLATLARECLERLCAHSGAALRVTDKMPANFLYAGLIHAALPRARIIHMQRDPLDTCLSAYFQNFFNVSPYTNDLASLAHYYAQYLRIMAHWRSVLPAAALLEVSYEGLVEDHELWTRRMLDFLGLPFDARCLEFERTERVVITASKWQVRQKISTASVGRWHNYAKHLAALQPLVEGLAAGAEQDDRPPQPMRVARSRSSSSA